MTVSDRSDGDAVREQFLRLKRHATNVKLDALLREAEPATDINDLDAIVAEIVAEVESRRQTRPAHDRGTSKSRSRDLSGFLGRQSPL